LDGVRTFGSESVYRQADPTINKSLTKLPTEGKNNNEQSSDKLNRSTITNALQTAKINKRH
jgi:hypothetical protein